jgi:RNA polymerase sigma factor (sigma-70 family)
MRRRRDPLSDPEALIRRVYSYAAYRIGPGAEAEDVTSATIERALRHRESYDARKGTPEAWILGIARRCLSEQISNRLPIQSELPEAVASQDLAAEAVARIDLQRAIARLSDRDQELLALRYGADLSARQIGELLELPTNAVEVALHRAIERLRPTLLPAGAASASTGPARTANG